MQRLDQLLPLTIKKLGITKRYNAESAIYHWRKIVGDKIAANAKPLTVQRDLLLVAVSSSTWSHHLSMMKQDIINKINAFIGDNLIKDIRFQAGYLKDNQNQENAGQAGENEIKLHNIKLEATELKNVNDLVKSVGDADLQTKLKNIIKSDLKLKKARHNGKWHKCLDCSVLCPPEETFCFTCKLNHKQRIREEIYTILIENPWLGYSELRKHIDASFDDFKEVKNRLISALVNEISGEQNDRIKELTLVMLATGIQPEQITDALVNNTLKRFRRKNHVSASRS
ncbi:MAG: DUF721 domain-containing protein [Veillonellaceae bacterium]|jgi:hypothetical protein|nr:DUF721 domain-containing protein [Veillonellaceae bacterium]